MTNQRVSYQLAMLARAASPLARMAVFDSASGDTAIPESAGTQARDAEMETRDRNPERSGRVETAMSLTQ